MCYTVGVISNNAAVPHIIRDPDLMVEDLNWWPRRDGWRPYLFKDINVIGIIPCRKHTPSRLWNPFTYGCIGN